MSHFADMGVRVFDRAWPLFGSPTLRVYGPISGWTLATGVTYNSLTDTFLDADGDPVTVAYSTQPYSTVGYVPGSSGGDSVEVSIPGVTETERELVTVKWTSAVAAALSVAWGLEVPAGSGNLYRIANRADVPKGTPSLIRLELTERG